MIGLNKIPKSDTFLIYSLFFLFFSLNLLFYISINLFYEDSLIENIQAFLLLCSLLISLKKAFSKKYKQYKRYYLCLFFSIGFVFLEEISYGQRLFNFNTPSLFININQQGEFNIHNIKTGLLEGVICICFFILSFISLLYSYKRRKYIISKWDILIPSLNKTKSSILLFLLLLILMVYNIIDFSSYYEEYEEIYETLIYFFIYFNVNLDIKNL